MKRISIGNFRMSATIVAFCVFLLCQQACDQSHTNHTNQRSPLIGGAQPVVDEIPNTNPNGVPANSANEPPAQGSNNGGPSSSAGPPQGETDNFSDPRIPATLFGLTYMRHYPDVPMGSTRSWDGKSIHWSDLNPSKGNFGWNKLEAVLKLTEDHKNDFLFVFGRTPGWAASGSGTQPPANIQDWDDFVRAIATQEKGRIKFWEIWNEFNLKEFYTGSIYQLADLAEHAYKILHSIDPSAVVLSPSLTGSSPSNAALLECYLKPKDQPCPSGGKGAGGGAWADVIAFHGYTGGHPESVLPVIQRYKQAMTNAGVGNKPMWDTEGSWAGGGATDQVAYVARIYLLKWSVGIKRFYWYAWDNSQWGGLYNEGSKVILPSGIAYREVYKWMVGAVMKTPCTKTGSTYNCGLARENGYEAVAVWNENDQASSFQVDTKFKQYRALDGEVRQISGSSVQIGSKPILIETGPGI